MELSPAVIITYVFLQMITAEAPVLVHDVAKLGANQMKNRYINIMAGQCELPWQWVYT